MSTKNDNNEELPDNITKQRRSWTTEWLDVSTSLFTGCRTGPANQAPPHVSSSSTTDTRLGRVQTINCDVTSATRDTACIPVLLWRHPACDDRLLTVATRPTVYRRSPGSGRGARRSRSRYPWSSVGPCRGRAFPSRLTSRSRSPLTYTESRRVCCLILTELCRRSTKARHYWSV